MSIINTDDKQLMKFKNISECSNVLSLLIDPSPEILRARIVETIYGLMDLAQSNSKIIKQGLLSEFNNIIELISTAEISWHRKDPETWFVNIYISLPKQGYIFLSASIGQLIVISNILSDPIVLADYNVRISDIVSLARGRMERLAALAQNAVLGRPRRTALILGSERLYDSIQSLIAAFELIKSKKDTIKLEIFLIGDLGLLEKEFVETYIDREVRVITRKELIHLQQAPDIDLVISLNWHWPSKSPADIENIKCLLDAVIKKLNWDHGVEDRKSVFIALELEKRVWLEQKPVLVAALQELSRRYGFTHVYLNGMTAPPALESAASFFEEVRGVEENFMRDILQDAPNVSVTHLHRATLSDKIKALLLCEYFIAPAGSASLLPIVCRVPGICFGLSDFLIVSKKLLPTQNGEVHVIDPKLAVPLSGDMSIQKYSWSTNTPQGRSYSISENEFMRIFRGHIQQYLE